MNRAVEIDLQDMSAYSSSSNKHPIAIINEYAIKNRLVPYYNLIHDDNTPNIVRFKYSLTLDKFVAEGEGYSKKKAKHLAASNLLKKIIADKPQKLNTDFNECAFPMYDNNIKVNAVFRKMIKAMEIDQQDITTHSSSSDETPITIINYYASRNHLVPHYNIIHDNSPLSIASFKYSLTLCKFVATGKGSSKKEAKHLAASNLIEKMIDYKSKLLNTDFNECAISSYDNNIKVNAFFRKLNEAMEIDLQDISAHSSSLNKTPITIINEYAIKHCLDPHYNLVYDGFSEDVVSFKYNLTLDKFVAEGEGSSIREAKNFAASNLLEKIIDNESQLLNTDFYRHKISPYDININVNSIAQLNDMCIHNNIELPKYNLVKEDGQDHNKLFTISCHAAKMIETATQRTKKQAKKLAAFQMVNSLMSSDIVIEKCQNVSQSTAEVIEKCQNVSQSTAEVIEKVKSVLITKSAPNHLTCVDYHLVFKTIKWNYSDTLNMIVNQYIKNGKLDLPEPYNILKKIVTQHKMHLNSRVKKYELDFNNYYYSYTFGITDVYPPVYGLGVNTNSDYAQHIAVKDLLIGICILLK